MNEEQFFNKLQDKAGQAFQTSPIKLYQNSLQKSWSYSICATPIQKEKGILIGLNWGGGGIKDNTKYLPQPNMPSSINYDPKAYKFIKALEPYLNKYFEISINEINYSNLCFFRSPTIYDLKDEDWKLSIPLFIEFCKFINPPWIIFTSISKSKIEKLNLLNCIESGLIVLGKQFSIKQGEKEFIGYEKGKFNNSTNLYAVPYPITYRAGGINKDSREKIWGKLFE